MNRSNVILIAAGAVVVVASGVLAFLAQGKFAASSKAEKSIKSNSKKLEEVYQSKLFPSPENVEALKAQAESLSSMRSAFTNELAKFNTPAPQVTPPRFAQVLTALTRSLVDKAPIVDGKKCVSPGFAFGFDRYLGPTAMMPEAGDVPRLLQQLYVIANEGIVKELYDAQVSHISAISREVFESGASATPEPESGGGGRRRGSRASASHGRPVEPSKENFNGLFSSQHFRIEFTAHQSAALAFLNGVASMKKYFCVVTDVSFRKIAPDVVLPSEKTDWGSPQPVQESPRKSHRRRGGGENQEPREEEAPAEESLAVQKTSSLPAELRVMSGPEVDPVLAVSVDLDVYYFGRNPAFPTPAATEEE